MDFIVVIVIIGIIYLIFAIFRDRFRPTEVSNEKVNNLEKLLGRLGEKLTSGLVAELRKWRQTHVDIEFLKSFGRMWDDSAMDFCSIKDSPMTWARDHSSMPSNATCFLLWP
ncbi:MAG: hypothetical protein ACE5HI_10310 [bacterium]